MISENTHCYSLTSLTTVSTCNGTSFPVYKIVLDVERREINSSMTVMTHDGSLKSHKTFAAWAGNQEAITSISRNQRQNKKRAKLE